MSQLTGKVLKGRYRVDEFIGRGGMAEVYKVWDSHLSAHLAMKVLREDLAEDRVFLRRFKREARTLARLQHPHIIRFYGLDQDEIHAFILMDFVEGTTLRREIFQSSGPSSEKRILEVFRSVCSAVGFAHGEGVIHCDLKPGNIMIDRSGRVLVTDFGIARMTDAATATMIGMGTPAYMTPEQVRGADPSPQTDIYALGVVLFEMLTGGERPFTGDSATIPGSTSEKVRWEQTHLDPPSPKKWNPGVSSSLENVIFKCLQKDPQLRYQNVQQLLGALEAAIPRSDLEKEMESVPLIPVPIPINEPDTGARGENPLLVRREVPAYVILIVIVILVGGFMFMVGRGPPGPEPTPTGDSSTALATDTSSPTSTVTLMTPSLTQSPTLSLSPTAPHTPTPSDATIIIPGAIQCRSGSDKTHKATHYFNGGEVVKIIAVVSTGGWYLVQRPDDPRESRYCWVAVFNEDVYGDVNHIPAVTPMPTLDVIATQTCKNLKSVGTPCP